MMKTRKSLIVVLMVVSIFTASGCGGNDSGGSGPDTFTCPSWSAGDTMTYLVTETAGTVTTTTTSTVLVTERTTTSAVLSSGTTTWTYAVAGGTCTPLTEEYILSVDYSGTIFDYDVTDTYSSATLFCPPPGVGASYEYMTWIPGPFLGTGDYFPATMAVSSSVSETLSVPAGDFTATMLVMSKTVGQADSIVTRYSVSGIGVVKEVEEIPSMSTVVTKELTTYLYQ